MVSVPPHGTPSHLKDRTKYGVWQGRRKLSVAVLFFKLGIKIKGAYYVAIFDVKLIGGPYITAVLPRCYRGVTAV